MKITRRTTVGDVIARGAQVDRNRNGRLEPDECDFEFGFSTELFAGSREVTIIRGPDCSVLVDDIRDTNVVEPENAVAELAVPGTFARVRLVAGKLWEALFPTAFAQAYTHRGVYHHIYTCGIPCSGGIDGLTAQQGWLSYRFNGNNVVMNAAQGWYCTAGSFGGASNCQPPLEIAGAPMFISNTGWRAYNPWIVERVWGPGAIVRAADQVRFYWAPWATPNPHYYDHLLYNVRWAFPSGQHGCDSYVSGSWYNGPIKSICMTYTP